MFTTYTLASEEVIGVSGTTPILDRGSVVLVCQVNGKEVSHTRNNVMHVPAAPHCLISVGRLDDAGGSMTAGEGRCTLKHNNRIIVQGVKCGRLLSDQS